MSDSEGSDNERRPSRRAGSRRSAMANQSGDEENIITPRVRRSAASRIGRGRARAHSRMSRSRSRRVTYSEVPVSTYRI